MKTLYDSDSYESHVRTATELGIPVKLFFSKRVMSDVDTPEDARQLAKETGPPGGETFEFLKSLLK
jgi:2-phospho-L-lactate guanylyltransferase (CobY/MobA/RfbA family)